jgi:hypothetical protein
MLGRTPVLDEVIEVASNPGLTTRCRLRLFRSAGGRQVAVVTELAENTGASVTNAAEDVWRALARRLDTTRFTMVEHYGPESGHAGAGEETFDVVTVANGKPGWQPITADDLHRLMEDT